VQVANDREAVGLSRQVDEHIPHHQGREVMHYFGSRCRALAAI
jgi:hypothetical protein